MARQQLSNIRRQRIAPAARVWALLEKGNGPRGNGDRFKAKTRSSNQRSLLMNNLPTENPISLGPWSRDTSHRRVLRGIDIPVFSSRRGGSR